MRLEGRGDPVDIAHGLAMAGLAGALRRMEVGLWPLPRVHRQGLAGFDLKCAGHGKP